MQMEKEGPVTVKVAEIQGALFPGQRNDLWGVRQRLKEFCLETTLCSVHYVQVLGTCHFQQN